MKILWWDEGELDDLLQATGTGRVSVSPIGRSGRPESPATNWCGSCREAASNSGAGREKF